VTPETLEAFFTRASGDYVFARWGRPIAPVVFGVEQETLTVIKGALEALSVLSGHALTETDAELGSNLMLFFFKDWDELPAVPHLDQLVPDLVPLVERLKAAEANQYRIFRFDDQGGIKAAFVFIRMDRNLSEVPAETLALSQAVQVFLLWSDTAFLGSSPLAVVPGQETTVLKPEIGGLIRAAYDPILPVATTDKSHALRLFARLGDSQ
jgi:hypothetical protein